MNLGRQAHLNDPRSWPSEAKMMMFLDCPAYLDQDGAVRCGLPTEVRCQFTMRSTGGPMESAMITCPNGHHFTGPLESLTWDGTDNHDPGTAGASSRARRGRLQGHDGRHSGGGSALREFLAEPGRRARRRNGAPAYYQGRPAALWINAMSPRRKPATPRDSTEAAAPTSPR